MKKLVTMLIWFCSIVAVAQNVTITPGGIIPNLGGNYPRITYDEILELPSPIIGDIAYDITFHCLRFYNGENWICSNQQDNIPKGGFIAGASGDYNSGSEGNAIVTDTNGNVFVTGYVNGISSFGSLSVDAIGVRDVFIAKYNASGNLIWYKHFGSYFGNAIGKDLELDSLGSIYITGSFEGGINFGPQTLTSLGNEDIFVAKFSPSGDFLWAKSAGGSGSENSSKLVLDKNANIYITGYFSGLMTFDSATIAI